jgi:probable rRNA maturation factor
VVIFRKPIVGASELAMARFLLRVQRAAGVRGRIAVLVTGNRELRALNRRFRGQDHATDVLSFPTVADAADGFQGDIALSAQIAAASAARLGHSIADELKILILHGVLHLAGYDHESDRGEMSRLEARLRSKFSLPGNLIQRSARAGRRRRRA